MGDKTGIEWTDATWNPVTGCTKVSQGCKFCYAETVAERFWAKQYPPNEDGTPRKFTDVRMHYERLNQPLMWKKPRRIFVNSMSDLFHEKVPNFFISSVFEVMASTPHHTYQILTKRPELMQEYVYQWTNLNSVLPNVWLGVSVEDQKAADERIPWLLKTPAAVRFLSCEPLLGPIDLTGNPEGLMWPWAEAIQNGQSFDWVICGGESGQNARPMHPDWACSLRDQCQEAGVPFFFKQWGEWKPGLDEFIEGDNRPRTAINLKSSSDEYQVMQRVGKKAAGRLLDGREWNEFPEVE